MWDPDEPPSEAEDDDDDEYEDIDIHLGDSSASESEDDAGPVRRRGPNEHGGEEQRRANDRNANGPDDEKAE
jgi:hypothetical protein